MNSMSEKYEYDATVIIPVYNGAAFIEKQLQAIAAQQTNRSFEVLVSDNGSTDNTVALVEAFNAPYPCAAWTPATLRAPPTPVTSARARLVARFSSTATPTTT